MTIPKNNDIYTYCEDKVNKRDFLFEVYKKLKSANNYWGWSI